MKTPRKSTFPPSREPVVHRVKCWPDLFAAVQSGEKTFEYRRNDRGYATGDYVILHEWDPTTETYSGKTLSVRVGYMLAGMGVPEDYCLFSVQLTEVPAKLLEKTPETEKDR